MTQNENTAKKTPAFIAYHVPERDGAPWVRLGAAWPHKDGKGFDLSLELIPVGTGRITLRQFETRQEAEAGA